MSADKSPLIARRPVVMGLAGSMLASLWNHPSDAAEFPFKDDPARYTKEIDKFAEHDLNAKPAAGGVLFVGSSSIRMWNVQAAFPGLPTINRGFGGSQLSDAVYYTDRVIWPYAPSTIVIYSGDNDINAGKSAERVANDYAALVKRIREKLPEARIVYLSIKPSPARWKHLETQRDANRRIESLTQQDKRSKFVDLGPSLLDEQGMPKDVYFLRDRLHLSFLGYHQWNEVLRPILSA
jgi:lysophospholipase L1-like esterase